MLWLWRVLIALDQFCNALFGPLLNLALAPAHLFGHPDETLSSVFGKNGEACKFCTLMCRMLHWFDKDHCAESIEADEGN